MAYSVPEILCVHVDLYHCQLLVRLLDVDTSEFTPCAPVPLCTARSSLRVTTASLTTSTRLLGPQTTIALSPYASSSSFRMMFRQLGRPERIRIGLGYGLSWTLSDGVVEDVEGVRA